MIRSSSIIFLTNIIILSKGLPLNFYGGTKKKTWNIIQDDKTYKLRTII